jgi:hypothetical protein
MNVLNSILRSWLVVVRLDVYGGKRYVDGASALWTASMLAESFFFFILRHGAHGLWPKDEKERKKGEKVTAAKETRKHTKKQAKLLPSLSPRLSAPQHYRLLSRQIQT